MNVTSDFHPAMLCHAYAMPSFYAVRPPMGPTDSPTSITNWGIFPSQSAADAYAATFAPVAAAADSSATAAPTSTAAVQGFSDAMSAIVYASRGTVVLARKKKRKKRDDGGSGAFAAVYKGGAAGACTSASAWLWLALAISATSSCDCDRTLLPSLFYN